MRHPLLLLGFFTVFVSPIIAQTDFYNLEEEQIYRPGNKYNTWSFTAGYGPVTYYTDVIDYALLPSHHWKFGPTLMLSKQFGRPWSIDAQFTTADMYGEKNKRYFYGNFMDFTLNLNVSINQLVLFGPIRDKWNIYGKIGLGLNYFRARQRNIETDAWMTVADIYDGTPGYPSPYGWLPSDYLAIGYNRNGGEPVDKQSRRDELVIPIGMGVEYRINKSFDVGVELTLRNMNQDNLDVNMTGADNDSYMHTAFTLTYKIGKKDKRHALWTYKDFMLDYERDRLKDPLAQRLDSLRQQLDNLAANDSSVTDTTVITRETVVRRQDMAASVFFDFDKSQITTRSHKVLAHVAKFMNENPQTRMMVQGYCDERGSDAYNVKLSQRRCDAVVDVLVKDYGLNASRFETEPRGETGLLSDTKKLSPRGIHLANRRVDIFLINP